jgi:hypothetical protein
MKRVKQVGKLQLKKETLQRLTDEQLSAVGGGQGQSEAAAANYPSTKWWCSIACTWGGCM